MPPPIATTADLDAMFGNAQEGQRLEFKEDIPVHETRIKQVAAEGGGRARDTWWRDCQSVAAHGRDEILAEIVAFANAQGGTLILGIEEDDARTARAFSPVPGVTLLENKFRAFLVEHIEPRLSHCRVQSIPTESDGSGILVFEVEPSRLGPHWVKSTRRATIRRDDKCMPLSMMEIQEMTLRNARRFDEVRQNIDGRLGRLAQDFHDYLLPAASAGSVGGTADQIIEAWLKRTKRSTFPLRMVVVAHEDLGISRLQDFQSLVPSTTCVGEEGRANPGLTTIWPHGGVQRRFLGGTENEQDFGLGKLTYKATREGVVEATALIASGENEPAALGRNLLVGMLGCCFGIYDKLRERSGRLHVPAEVGVYCRTIGTVHASNAESQLAAIAGGRLPSGLYFPRRTGADAVEFSEILTETAQDLLDAANSSVAHGRPTQFKYYPKL